MSSECLMYVQFTSCVYGIGTLTLICKSKLNPGQVRNGHKREHYITLQSILDCGKVENKITQWFFSPVFYMTLKEL